MLDRIQVDTPSLFTVFGPNAGNGLEDFIEEEEDEKEEKTDPRWDQLKNLLNK